MRLIGGSAVVLGCSGVLGAQQATSPRLVTADDYARAERFMGYNTTPLVLHAAGRATWLPGAEEKYWYRTTTEKGNETFLVDAATGAKSPCDLRQRDEATSRVLYSSPVSARVEPGAPPLPCASFT